MTTISFDLLAMAQNAIAGSVKSAFTDVGAAMAAAAPPPAAPPMPPAAPAAPMQATAPIEPIKPKIDVNIELMQIKKMIAKICDTMNIQIPASDMVATQDDLTNMAFQQQNVSGPGQSAIPPISPIGAAAPGMDPSGGAGGGMGMGMAKTSLAINNGSGYGNGVSNNLIDALRRKLVARG